MAARIQRCLHPQPVLDRRTAAAPRWRALRRRKGRAVALHHVAGIGAGQGPDRVNAIAPGSIAFDDGLWDRRRTEDPALYHGTLAKILFGRFGHPREIADAALFLCSPLARWVTGSVLNVDGGQVLMG